MVALPGRAGRGRSDLLQMGGVGRCSGPGVARGAILDGPAEGKLVHGDSEDHAEECCAKGGEVDVLDGGDHALALGGLGESLVH